MLQKVSLFQEKKDLFIAFFILAFISFYSLLMEYNNYINLTKFDSQIINATLLKQYSKTKVTKNGKSKSYQVLKLKTSQGALFYTSSKNLSLRVGAHLQLEVWAGKISFYEYMRSFYAFSKILREEKLIDLKQELNLSIQKQHLQNNIAAIYQALYTAKQLSKELQQKFSSLGISHLVAISGFHLGVLSALLFFLFKKPYQILQNRFFPYRSYKVDSFVLIIFLLFAYMLFLDTPASLLRAFSMLFIGFILYDRGIQLLSMQTLFITTLLLLALFPRLIFSLGFGLSIGGVFYILLFLIHFKHLSKLWQFFLLPVWVYLMMLPYSLIIFGNFSFYHPLSIVWSTLFTIFYPLSIFLHLINQGDFLDIVILKLTQMNNRSIVLDISTLYLLPTLILSFLGLFWRRFLFVLLLNSLVFLTYSYLKL